MKIFLISMLFTGVMYSSNSFAKCAAEHKGPCNDYIITEKSNDLNEYPAEKLKEDHAKADAAVKKKVVDKDYLYEAKNSAIKMLIQASKFYKDGAITKEQYIKVADQVSMMAEYADANNCINMGLTGSCEENVSYYITKTKP